MNALEDGSDDEVQEIDVVADVNSSESEDKKPAAKVVSIVVGKLLGTAGIDSGDTERCSDDSFLRNVSTLFKEEKVEVGRAGLELCEYDKIALFQKAVDENFVDVGNASKNAISTAMMNVEERFLFSANVRGELMQMVNICQKVVDLFSYCSIDMFTGTKANGGGLTKCIHKLMSK
jgi:hypothetical protein